MGGGRKVIPAVRGKGQGPRADAVERGWREEGVVRVFVGYQTINAPRRVRPVWRTIISHAPTREEVGRLSPR